MMLALEALAGAIGAVAVVGLFLYGVNAYVMVGLHWWHHRHPRPAPPPPADWPSVTVQLPIYNERYVAHRLLSAVGALDYPAPEPAILDML